MRNARWQGVKEVDWEQFAALSKTLAEELAPRGVEAIVGIARTGLFPATLVACSLCYELYPARVVRSSRIPVVTVDLPLDARHDVIAVIDEVAHTGRTLALVAGHLRALGVLHVLTASLVSHSWADPAPDIAAWVTDAYILFPWERRVYVDGRWQVHPDVQRQGLAARV